MECTLRESGGLVEIYPALTSIILEIEIEIDNSSKRTQKKIDLSHSSRETNGQ